MSWGFEDAVMHHSPATASDKLLLLCIAKHETEEYGAFPSVTTLARFVNADVRTVQRTIQRLVTAGELSVEERSGKTTIYRTTAKCPENCTGAPYHRDRVSGDRLFARTPGADAGGQDADTPTSTPGVDVTPGVGAAPASASPDPRRGRHPNKKGNTKIPLTPASGGMIRRPHCPQHRRWRAGCADCRNLADPPKQRPPWCGRCDEETRIVLDDEQRPVGRCPTCHPTNTHPTA